MISTRAMLVSGKFGRRLWLPWALCAFALAAAGGCVVLDILDRARIHSFHDAQPIGPVLAVSFSALGAVIVSRRPDNRIGWIYLLIGVLLPLQSVGTLYYEHSVLTGGSPGARWAAWLSNWAALPVFPTGLALFAFLLFPNGRLPSPRWRPLAWAAAVQVAVMVVLTLLDPMPIDVGGGFPTVANVTGIRARALGHGFDTAVGVLYLVGILLIATAIGSLILRRRRAAVREREQVKLLVYAAALTIGCILAVSIASVAVPVGNSIWDVMIVFGFGVAVPVACGLAILRHGLYEIDRLISRTISYAILTALLAGVFVGLVVLATDVLPFSSPVAVAASTLAAAALFNPLRVRIQRAVDRRFNRSRYDAEAIVSAFGARLRDAVDLVTVQWELEHAVARAVEPTHVSLWLPPSS